MIDYNIDNNYIFPDFDSWEMLHYTLGEDLHDAMDDDQFANSQFPFDLDREGYKKIIRAIPYMLIEQTHVCPCCVKFDNQFFYNFLVPGPIDHYKCDSKPIVFKDRTSLLKNLKTDTRPEKHSTINRFHQIFYIW